MSNQLTQKIDFFNQSISKDEKNLNSIILNLANNASKNLNAFSSAQKQGRLFGKTFAIKDNINIKGVPMTCGSEILKDYVSPYNATVIDRIDKEGGLILGTANMDEFAMGSSTEYSIYGATKNTYGENLVAGGSSGGSAVSVASDIVDLSLGSDTGGSVRQPASFCGVLGLKPTYGRISRFGLTAFASSFDQIGIFSKNIDDMATLFSVISGYDCKDSTSSKKEVEEFVYSKDSTKKLKIGLPYKLNNNIDVDPEVLKCYNESINYLKNRGFEIVDLDMKNLKYAVSVYYILTTAEASSNLSRFDGIRYGLSMRNDDLDSIYVKTKTEGFGDEVKRRIIIGTYVLSSGYYDAYYSKAQKVRKIIKIDFDSAFKKVDLLFLPTAPELPYKMGEKKDDPLSMYLSDTFTVPMNLSGIPAISVPLGESQKGLSIGMQFAANNFQENKLFSMTKFLFDENKIKIK